jgi:diguanylate cyclase (GGDEF)-like protein
VSELRNSMAQPSRSASSASSLLDSILGLSLGGKLHALLLVAALPLCLVTAYQAFCGWRSSRDIAQEFPTFVLVVKRDAQFKIFMEGAADAVDTGTLSNKAVYAVREARLLSDDVGRLSGIPSPGLAADLGRLVATVSQDQSRLALLSLSEEIYRSSKAISATAQAHHDRMGEIVSDSIHASQRDTLIALATVGLSMTGAFWVGRRLIQNILRVEQRERDGAALNRAIMDAAPIGMMTIADDSTIVTANRASHLMHGYNPGDLVGQHVQILNDPDDVERYTIQRSGKPSEAVRPATEPLPSVASGQPMETEWTYVRKDGSRFPAGVIALPLLNAAGLSLGGLRMVVDITERKRAAAKIEHMALHDSLTGLPNRLLLQDRVAQTLARVQRDSGVFAFALIDLDRFKQINDTLGHAIGDEVLKIVAQRLSDAVRSSDTVVRMGGDEFALLLPDIVQSEQAIEVGQKILAALSDVMIIETHRLHVSASIGVALYPADGIDLPALLRNADAAMYDAKARGRDAVSLYDEQMSDHATDMSELRADLREALTRDEFVLHYQPLVDAKSGKVRALEALLRWQHPRRGLMPPGEFIPLAEDSGLIVPIGAWALHQACADLARLRRDGRPGLRMTVNVSPRQFTADGLEASVSDALRVAGLEGSALELEITESTLMNSLDRTQSILVALRAMEVRLAIDDFGTGYSSLSYLAHFPVQTVKIDRGFVHQIDSGKGTALLAGAIVAMAHSLGLEVVAEGVETPVQQRHLVELGCELLQGFHFSEAVPVKQLCEAMDRVEAKHASRATETKHGQVHRLTRA